MKKNKWMLMGAGAAMMLMAACGTSRQVQGTGKVDAGKHQTSVKADEQGENFSQRAFLQMVSDNQVYAKDIVGKMDFTILMGDKEVSVPAKLSMRKDQLVRIQIFMPFLGSELGRLEFAPDYVLILDRYHKQYVKADYTQVDFLKKQGISFYTLQALFWNQLILPGEKEVTKSNLKKFDVNLNAAGNEVPVTVKNGYMTYAWNTSRENGRITSADVNYQSSQHGTSRLHVDYSKFKSVGVKMFPATQVMSFMTTATQKKQEMKLILNLNEVKTDSNWSTQTEISKKYKQVSPEEALRKIMSI